MSPGADYPTFAQIVGARIRARRTQLGWTQAELASRAKKHVTYLSRVESGSVDVRLAVVVDLAFALGIDVAELTTGLLPRGRRRRRRRAAVRSSGDGAPDHR